MSPVAAFLIPGGFIADLLISGGLAAVTEKFGNTEQEMSLTDLAERLENLIVWGEFLKEVAQTLASDSSFLNLVEKTKSQKILVKQFSQIKDNLVISPNFNDGSVLKIQIEKLRKSQQELESLQKNVIKIANKLEKVTNEDSIIPIIIKLRPYFCNTIFALEWLDDDDGLIISYGQNTKRFVEIIQDCLELKKEIHLTLEKVNNLLVQAEKSLKKFEIQQHPSLSNKFKKSPEIPPSQSHPVQSNYSQQIQQSNLIYKRIVQVMSVGIILGCVYVVGWLTRGNVNQVPQNSNNPVINSK